MTDASLDAPEGVLNIDETFTMKHGTGGYYGPSDQVWRVAEVTPTGYRIEMVDA
jgi:hypothetical protein